MLEKTSQRKPFKMVRCSVLNCKSDSKTNDAELSFHTFPHNPDLLKLWIAATGRNNWVPKSSSKMCSKHFERSFIIKKGNKTYVSKLAIPIKGHVENAPETDVYKCKIENIEEENFVPSLEQTEVALESMNVYDVKIETTEHGLEDDETQVVKIEPLASTSPSSTKTKLNETATLDNASEEDLDCNELPDFSTRTRKRKETSAQRSKRPIVHEIEELPGGDPLESPITIKKIRTWSSIMTFPRSRLGSISPVQENLKLQPALTVQKVLTMDNVEGYVDVDTKNWRQPVMSILVPAAGCGLDDVEPEDTVKEHDDHKKKLVIELRPSETMGITYRSMSVPEDSSDSMFSTASVHAALKPEPQTETSGYQGPSQMTPGDVDVRPSASEKTATSKRPAVLSADENDFESDSDVEFDLNEIASSAGMTRGIPDDEYLEESVSNMINSMETEMDEAVEYLVNTCNVFDWRADFDTFRGVPEKFSGPTPGSVKDYDNPYDVFTDIWSKDIMEYIAMETNRYAKKMIAGKKAAGTLKESSRLHSWVDTNVDELYVLFAAYILMRMVPRPSREYFQPELHGGWLGTPKFRQLISYNRYVLLNKFIHFEDNPDESQELPQSEGAELSPMLRKIAPVLSHLNAKFQSNYNLHQNVAIDDSLTLFKGWLSWDQATRSKAHFGYKSYELCELTTGYLYKFTIHAGKNFERENVTAPSAEFVGKSAEVFLDMLKGLEHLGHCVTMDDFYNSPSLARYLKSLGFDCLGTLRPNRKNVPYDIANASVKVPNGTIIARHSGDIACFAWKDNNMVNMISTYHNPETFVHEKSGRPQVKPLTLTVQDSNKTVGGGDLKDRNLSLYLGERKRYWEQYMKIFKWLLNVSVHNSLVLLLSSLKRRNMPVISHQDFRLVLANSLVTAHRPSPRENLQPVPEDMRLRRDIVHVPKILSRRSRMRCHICQRKGISKQVRTKCETCDEGLCFQGCWIDWHSLQKLPGRNVIVRKVMRRPH